MEKSELMAVILIATSRAEYLTQELTMLTSRLDQQVAKHQREQKILTAARTLAKLNSHNKRMSKQTSDSVTSAEQKVADAEKVRSKPTHVHFD